MKGIFKKFVVTFATVICAVCAFTGAFVSFNDDKAVAQADAVTEHDFWINDADIRLVNDQYGTGLRFHTYFADSVYSGLDIESTGTLMIPEHLYDGELTLEDMDKVSKERPVKVETTGYWSATTFEDEAVQQASTYMYNIPAKGFGWRMVTRSYVKLGDGSVAYSASVKASISDVATAVKNDETASDHLKFQVEPFIVETVDLTLVDLYGNTTTSPVAYGSKLVVPDTCKIHEGSAFEVKFYDQNGDVWDRANGEFTRATTLTAKMEQKSEVKTVNDTAFGNAWRAPKTAGDIDAPAGFTSVVKHTGVEGREPYNNIMGNESFNGVDLSAYSEVSFAMKFVNAQIQINYNANTSYADWVYFHLTQTSDSTWTVALTHEGNTTTYENQTGLDVASTSSTENTLITILYGGYYGTPTVSDSMGMRICWVADTTPVFYSTEIIGLEKYDPENYPAFDAVTVTDTAFGNAYYAPKGESDISAPEGFTSVVKHTATNWGDGATLGNQSFKAVAVSAYTEVWFALKLVNAQIQINWDYKTYSDWVYFHLTQTADGVWTIEMTHEGTPTTYENQTGLDTAGSASEANTLNAILYGGFYGGANVTDGTGMRLYGVAGQTPVVYSTEILAKGVGDGDAVLPDFDAGVILNSGFSPFLGSNAVENAEVGDVTAPDGYSYVKRYDSSTGWTDVLSHATAFHWNFVMTEYREIWFAYKLENCYIQTYSNWGRLVGDQWVYFHLVQTGTDTDGATLWTIEISNEAGELVGTYTNQRGVSVDTTLAQQGADTLAAIFYNAFNTNCTDGQDFRFRKTDTAQVATVYATEVKAIRVDGEAFDDLVELPSMGGDTVTPEESPVPSGTVKVGETAFGNAWRAPAGESDIDAPEGFTSVVKHTGVEGREPYNNNMGAESFNGIDLSAYTEVWFAMKFVNAQIQINYNGNTSYADWVYFHLTQTADNVWTVEMTHEGTTTTYENQTGLDVASTSSTENTLITILYGGYYGTPTVSDSMGMRIYWVADTTPVFYSTEIRVANKGVGTRVIWSAMDYSKPVDVTVTESEFGGSLAIPYGFTQVYQRTEFNDYFAKMNLASTDYTQLRFAMLHSGNLYVNVDRTRSISTNLSNTKEMYVVELNRSAEGWTVTMNCATWGSEGGTVNPYTFTSTGNSLYEIFTDFNVWSGVTVYTTEVRGSHTHTHAQYISNGNGTHKSVCFCGETMATEACTGGTATCTKAKVCDVCQTAYGTVDANAHEQAQSIIVNNDDTHTIKYNCCGLVVETTSCGGGTADCDTIAVCSVCNDPYGTYVHNMSWVNGEYKCSICGIVTDSVTVEYNLADTAFGNAWRAPVGESDIDAPTGFTSVVKHTADSTRWPYNNNMGTESFSEVDLSGYYKVRFAMKFVNAEIQINYNANTSYADWVYFNLTQTADSVWTIEMTHEGNTTTYENQTGLDVASTGSTANTLRTILYGGYYSTPTVSDDMGMRIYWVADTTPVFYSTPVMAYKTHDHFVDQYVSNGDGTHNGVCFCGVAVETNVACTGNENSDCGQPVCTVCKTGYGEAIHVGSYAWDGDNYVCDVCNDAKASFNTATLASQPFVMNTDGSNIQLDGTYRTGTVPVSLEEAFSDTSFTVNSATFNGSSVTATKEDGTFNVKISKVGMTNALYGDVEITMNVSFYGRDFDVTVPVIVVTNLITTDEGMQNMKYVLRGANNDGTGMQGQGYYMLGADITLTTNTVYTFGTSATPFVGTFDGNGHVLNDYTNVQWFGGDGYTYQDPAQQYPQYVDGSFFGIVNGKIKNVAFMGVRVGLYANLVHSGTGIVEDVYVAPFGLQMHAKTYTSLFFTEGYTTFGAGTLKNVVVDMSFQAYTYDKGWWSTANLDSAKAGEAETALFPAVIGSDFVAQNVAVYGFPKDSVTATAGNIYKHNINGVSDGRNAGIYATYADFDGSSRDDGATDNGGYFAISQLDPTIWKVVGGRPVLKNVTHNAITGAITDVSAHQPSAPTNEDVFTEGSTEYYFAWDWANVNQNTFDAYTLISNYAHLATGASIKAGTEDLSKENLKQIIVGTYEQYGDYASGASAVAEDARANYGVYVDDKTIYVLGETDEAIMYAAKALARELFGLKEIASDHYTYDDLTGNTVALIDDYETAIAYSLRGAGSVLPNGKTESLVADIDQQKMGFSNANTYTVYAGMHNTLDYFYDFSSGTATVKDGYTGTASNITSTGSTTPTKTTAQLCYRKDFQIKAEWVANVIKGEKEADNSIECINFFIEDNSNYCNCGGYSNPSIPQLIFLNEVAYKLEEMGVDVDIILFAYSHFQASPVLTANDISILEQDISTYSIQGTKVADLVETTLSYVNTNSEAKSQEVTVLKAHEGIRLQWTSHKVNHSFELNHPMNEKYFFYLLGWIESVGVSNIELFLYQTYYRDYFLPMNTWKYQVSWYKTFNELGIQGRISQLGMDPWFTHHRNAPNSQTSFTAFKTYIDSRAMTDANVTYEQLKAEFFSTSGYYGAGGPTMLEYFNELEQVLEERKTGGGKQIVSITNGDYSQLDWTELEADYGLDNAANWRQANFNGFYNMQLGVFMYNTDNTSGSSLNGYTVNGRTDIYAHSNYASQQATLEAWYNMCQDAKALVTAGSVYEQRIDTEAVFPEYAFLYLHTTYKTKLTTSTIASGSALASVTAPSSTVFTRTYQEFYEYIVDDIGVNRLSEFYLLDSTNGNSVYEGQCVVNAATDRYVYSSPFKNWGVTFNKEDATTV